MSYSLELGEVPFKVEEMAGACSNQLKTLSYSIASLDPTNTKQFLQRIGSLRQKLFFIDNQLNKLVIFSLFSLKKGFAYQMINRIFAPA